MADSTKRKTKVKVAIWLNVEQKQNLDKLTAVTRVPWSEYVREAIDSLLKKYQKELKKRPR